MPRKGYKQTEEHKRNVYLASEKPSNSFGKRWSIPEEKRKLMNKHINSKLHRGILKIKN